MELPRRAAVFSLVLVLSLGVGAQQAQILQGTCADSVRPACLCNATCSGQACGLRPPCLCTRSCSPRDFIQGGLVWPVDEPASGPCRAAISQDTAAMRSSGIKARLLMLGDSIMEFSTGMSRCVNSSAAPFGPTWGPERMLPVLNEARARYCPLKVHAVQATNTSRLMHSLLTGERDTGSIVQPGGVIMLHAQSNDLFLNYPRFFNLTAAAVAERLQAIVQLLITMTRGRVQVVVVTGIPRCYAATDTRTPGRCQANETVAVDSCWRENSTAQVTLQETNRLMAEWAQAMNNDSCLNSTTCFKGRVKTCDCASSLLTPDGLIDKAKMPDCVHPNAAGWKAMWDGCMSQCLQGLQPDPLYAACCPSNTTPISWNNRLSCAATATAARSAANPYCVQQGNRRATFTACAPGPLHQFCPFGTNCRP